jgi:ubiquinone/menaquinone biosynthesis C-methylase UbiE
MPRDKSLAYYGWMYHKLMDPPLAEACQVVVDVVPEGSSVLDIACGTGQLCFALREKKHCRVVGVDLSLRMLRFADKSNRYNDVRFVHQDATDLAEFGDGTFDYATMALLLHELPRQMGLCALSEALRVADNVVIVDAKAPLPMNPRGILVRFVEATFGRDHYGHFRNFLARGGITGILENSGLPMNVAHRSVFWRNCREVVVISRKR